MLEAAGSANEAASRLGRYVLIHRGHMRSRASCLAKDKQSQETESTQEDFMALNESLADLREQVKDLKQKAAKTVTERPLLALGVAFVIGMAFGIALSGSRD